MAQSNGHLAEVARTYADDGAQAERQYAEDVATAFRDHSDTWYPPSNSRRGRKMPRMLLSVIS